MSPRAAWRLESLGFQRVYDYVAGKADWAASGLPTEGRLASLPNAGDLARREVPTCGLADRMGDLRERLRASGQVIVVNEAGVVLGRIKSDALEGDPERPAESVMEAGPSTFRPNVPIEEMADYMDKRDMESAVITTSEGRLMGVLYRVDIERARSRAAGRRG